MKFLRENAGKLLLCLCELVVSILLFINPIGFTTHIIRLIGMVLIVAGIIGGIQYFRTDPETAALSQGLAKSLVALSGGLFCFFCYNWFILSFPILTILYGIATLLTGFFKIQWTVDNVRMKGKQGLFLGIDAAVTVLFAFIILTDPFSTATLLWYFVAVSFIVSAVLDLVFVFFRGWDRG